MSADDNLDNVQQPARPAVTSDESLKEYSDEVFRLMSSYEALVVEIQEEAKQYRFENEKLREEFAAVVAENTELKNQTSPNEALADFRRKHLAADDRIFVNLRNQIFFLSKEKEMFEALWKGTAKALRQEVPNSSLQAEHELEVKRLQHELSTMTKDFDTQSKMMKILETNAKKLLVELTKLQMANDDLKKKLTSTESDKDELEKCFIESNELNKEQLHKSSKSFQKLQDTIKVADEAVAEIEILIREKTEMEVECDTLAKTIGTVIHDASEEMEKVVDKLRQDKKETCKEITRLKHELEGERARAEQQMKSFEEKIASSEQINSQLNKDLQTAIQSIATTDEKISALKHAIETEERKNKAFKFEITALKKIIANSARSKEKYRDLVIEITQQLESKITTLILENSELRSFKASIV